MTKYILHGGATRNKSEDNKKFFFEMTEGLPDNVTVLCVYFAKEKKLWAELMADDRINFFSASPRKVLNLIMADDRPEILAGQIKQAEVIYFRGGNTTRLKESLCKVKNLAELLRGKVISGSSAGAYILARYYHGNDNDAYFDAIGEGLGILPIKIFAHYTDEHSDQLEKLKKYGDELKVYAIPEENYFVIKQ